MYDKAALDNFIDAQPDAEDLKQSETYELLQEVYKLGARRHSLFVVLDDDELLHIARIAASNHASKIKNILRGSDINDPEATAQRFIEQFNNNRKELQELIDNRCKDTNVMISILDNVPDDVSEDIDAVIEDVGVDVFIDIVKNLDTQDEA